MNSISGIGGNYSFQNFPQSAQDRFNSADIDKSGSLSKDEFLSATEQVSKPIDPEKIFNRMDSNGDGTLTHKEQQAFQEQMAERMERIVSMSEKKAGAETGFDILREALSSSDRGNEQQQFRSQDLNQGESRQSQERLISKALEKISSTYPPIDISV